MSQENSQVVSEKHQEIRLDRFLLIHLSDLSRSALQRLIKAGHVTVNGKVRTPHYLLRIGEKVEYSLPKAPKKVDTSSIALPIVFEDENFFVMDKPAGIAVHPVAGMMRGREATVTDVLQKHHAEKMRALPESFRSGIVHRLDRDTSGLLIVAKNEKTRTYFQKLFHDRKIEKEYTTLVFGHLEPKKGIIEAPLTRSDRDRKKISVSAKPDARYAVTHYEVIQYFSGVSAREANISFVKSFPPITLLRVMPKTGRTHQIRVHLSAIGYPIVGDKLYGNVSLNKFFEQKMGLKRQFLHATALKFMNPGTRKKQVVRCELASDLQEVLERLSW